MSSLPLAVSWGPDESPSSWITAVAARYRSSVSEFTRLVGIDDGTPWLNPFRLDTEGIQSSAARSLAAELCMPSGVSSDLTQGLAPYCAVREVLTRAQWTVVSPGRASRYCPECLRASGGRWNKWWRLPWMTACAEHSLSLRAGCPVCDGPQRGRHHTQVDGARGTRCDTWRRGRVHADDRCPGDLTQAAKVSAPSWVLAFQNRLVPLLRLPEIPPEAVLALRDLSAVRLALAGREISNRGNRPGGDLLAESIRIIEDDELLAEFAVADLGARPHALPRAFVGASAALEERVVQFRRSRIRMTDRLRWQAFGRPKKPHATSAQIGERLRRCPSRLWPAVVVALVPDDAPLSHTSFATMAVSCLRLVGAKRAADQRSTAALQYGFRALRDYPLEEDIYTALVHLAGAVDRGTSPIDYARRRAISQQSRLITADEWRVIARRAGVIRGGAPQLRAANAWVREVFTGNAFDAGRIPARWEELVRFGLSLDQDATALLMEHAQSLLAHHGIRDEPLEWQPDVAPLFPQPPVDVELAHTHLREDCAPFGGAAGAQRISTLRLWHALRLDPPKLGASTRSRPVGKHALTDGLSGHAIQKRLDAGESVRGIATATGISRQVLVAELKACGYSPPPVGRRTLPIPDADWLLREYAKRTAGDIGREFGVSKATVRRWLVQAGIPMRSRGAASHRSVVEKQRLPEPLRAAASSLQGGLRLRRFMAASSGRSMRDAAVKMQIDVASLSRQLALLAKHAGGRLFEPGDLDTALVRTPLGEMLLAQAKAHPETWAPEEVDN